LAHEVLGHYITLLSYNALRCLLSRVSIAGQKKYGFSYVVDLRMGVAFARHDTMRFHQIFSSFGQKRAQTPVEQLFYFHHSKKTLEMARNASVNISSFER
jgi:hypothetical protein